MDPIIASGLISMGRQVLPKIGNFAANMIQGDSFAQKLSEANANHSTQASTRVPTQAEWAVQKSQAYQAMINSSELFSQTSQGNWSSATLTFDDANGMAYLQNPSGQRISILPQSEAGQIAQQLRSFETKLGNQLASDPNGNSYLTLSKQTIQPPLAINHIRQASFA